jgi:hypothetical protein
MSEALPRETSTPGRRIVTGFVVAEVVLLLGSLLVRIVERESLLPAWAIATIAILSALPMCWFGFRFFRMLRGDLDEMIQRVVLEGMAFALVILIPLAGLYVNARTAGLISLELDPPELLLIPSLLAAAGILIAWSRLK